MSGNVRECQGNSFFLPRFCEDRNPCGVLEGGALPRRPAPPKARLPWSPIDAKLWISIAMLSFIYRRYENIYRRYEKFPRLP